MTTENSLSRIDMTIEKLTELTQDNKLIWSYENPNEISFVSEAEDIIFITKKDKKTLFLTNTIQEELRRLPILQNKNFAAALLNPNFETVEFLVPTLMVVDEEKNLVLWSENKSKLLSNLYSAVSFKAAGIEDLIDSILDS